MASNWNPRTHPWRVRRIYATGAAGMYGWRDSVETFETKEEAVAKCDEKMTGGCYEVEVTLAVLKDGKHVAWEDVCKRKINKKRVDAKPRKTRS